MTPLEKKLGHEFARIELLRQALTHRSYGTNHNERLEFLGDSLLNCVIAALLYEQFSGWTEGELSRQRANLVRQESLAKIANELQLSDCLRMGEGEIHNGGQRRPSILADTLEALFGAIYLDAGFATVFEVIRQLYSPLMIQLNPMDSGKDAKTSLQELLQGRKLALPQYSLLGTQGEDHALSFDMECVIPALNIRTRGTGSSRRQAEQVAAQEALGKINSESTQL